VSEPRDITPASMAEHARAANGLPGRGLIVAIGIDHYHHGQPLNNAVYDKWRDIGSPGVRLSTLRARRSRRIITSSLDDQVALDSGPVHGHSLFTGCLIEGLTLDLRRDGRRLTTGSELGLYVLHGRAAGRCLSCCECVQSRASAGVRAADRGERSGAVPNQATRRRP
jgi:hypothetical protein